VISCHPSITENSVFLSDAFQRTIDTFGTLDIVVNNAGIIDEIDWEKEVDINLVGHIRSYCMYIHIQSNVWYKYAIIRQTSAMRAD
jgi:short-subunit dehydrogenase involved in D-alanine esterification of teichoic acids